MHGRKRASTPCRSIAFEAPQGASPSHVPRFAWVGPRFSHANSSVLGLYRIATATKPNGFVGMTFRALEVKPADKLARGGPTPVLLENCRDIVFANAPSRPVCRRLGPLRFS